MGAGLQPLTAQPLTRQVAAANSAPTTTARAASASAVAASPVTVNQNFYGPTTSGGRLNEIDWTLRYAVGSRGTGPQEAFAR